MDPRLDTDIGKISHYSDFIGKNNVLLYFQEGIMCAPCWKQIEDIQKEYDKFKSLDIEILIIAVDPLNALMKESNNRGITLPVLDDADLAVSKAYDVLDYSMHPGSRPGHSFILVGKDGSIVWREDYYPAGQIMGGMNMNTGGRMYVPVAELLKEIGKVVPRLTTEDAAAPTSMTTSFTKASFSLIKPNFTGMVDHSMCITSIHKHADFKLYLGANQLNLSQRKFMDQSTDVHFHPTVKINPRDIPGIPVGDIVHIHKQNVTIKDFLNTLDFDNNTRKALNNEVMMKVYVNGTFRGEGLDYIINDGDRILASYVTNGTESEIPNQIESVTSYASIGKDKNPSLFGGC